MKKLMLTLLASLVLTGSALADWEKVAESDNFDRYIDPATIRKDGNLVKVWEITDYKKRDKDGHLSLRSRTEYDCKQERFRGLSISFHSGPMASSTTLSSWEGPFTWREIPPGTVSEEVLKIICAK